MEEHANDAHGHMRARAFGISIGTMETGRWNALTDVPGVRVGHCTVLSGDGPLISLLFAAVIEATEEPIINAIFAGREMIGWDIHRVPGLPVARVLAILRAHGRGEDPAMPPVGAE